MVIHVHERSFTTIGSNLLRSTEWGSSVNEKYMNVEKRKQYAITWLMLIDHSDISPLSNGCLHRCRFSTFIIERFKFVQVTLIESNIKICSNTDLGMRYVRTPTIAFQRIQDPFVDVFFFGFFHERFRQTTLYLLRHYIVEFDQSCDNHDVRLYLSLIWNNCNENQILFAFSFHVKISRVKTQQKPRIWQRARITQD